VTRRRARLALSLLPRDFRTRYGDEIRELLDHSSRPLADTLDVACLAVHLHLEVFMRHLLHLLSLSGLVVSLVVLGYTVNDLSSGITELPRHWWSSGAAMAVVATTAAALATHRRIDGAGTSRS
jgi:hypothetical protein